MAFEFVSDALLIRSRFGEGLLVKRLNGDIHFFPHRFLFLASCSSYLRIVVILRRNSATILAALTLSALR